VPQAPAPNSARSKGMVAGPYRVAERGGAAR